MTSPSRASIKAASGRVVSPRLLVFFDSLGLSGRTTFIIAPPSISKPTTPGSPARTLLQVPTRSTHFLTPPMLTISRKTVVLVLQLDVLAIALNGGKSPVFCSPHQLGWRSHRTWTRSTFEFRSTHCHPSRIQTRGMGPGLGPPFFVLRHHLDKPLFLATHWLLGWETLQLRSGCRFTRTRLAS